MGINKKTKYFIDNNGKFIGAFTGVQPPENAIEIKKPPEHGDSIWDGKKWQDSETKYKQNRLENYPEISDQLDVIWKELNSRQMAGEKLKTKEARDMLGHILQVKEDHPKPDVKTKKKK